MWLVIGLSEKMSEYVRMLAAKVSMRAGVVLAGLAMASVAQDTGAKNPREGWAVLKGRVNFELNLDHTLRDAPLTEQERGVIYAQIDGKTIHDSFRDDQREEERATVLSARVGLVAPAPDRGQQILVRGPSLFCGAIGNCELWVFIRQGKELRLTLHDEGLALIAGTGSYHGFTDLVVPVHDSAFETSFGVYRWNDTEYKQDDCYVESTDRDNNRVSIQDCPAAAR